MTTNLGFLLTALYSLIDDHMVPLPSGSPGTPGRLSGAELVCLAVAQVLLGACSELTALYHWFLLV